MEQIIIVWNTHRLINTLESGENVKHVFFSFIHFSGLKERQGIRRMQDEEFNMALLYMGEPPVVFNFNVFFLFLVWA